jgi:uncharacterized coiled-coil protein SlyX
VEEFKNAMYHIIPFLSTLSTNPPQNRPALTRLTEQAVVGALAAFVALQVTSARQEEQINSLRRDIRAQQESAERSRVEVREQIERIRSDLYTPKRS